MAGFEKGLLTYACDWADQAGSHLAWLQEPRGGPVLDDWPCSHPFELVWPEGLSPDDHGLNPVSGPRFDWALWLPLGRFDRRASCALTLSPVETERQWAAMTELRDEVEREYPGYRDTTAGRMVEHIRHRRAHLDGSWYLARVAGEVIGGVGLLVFQTPAGRVGRLQDVDVRPGFRGNGLGNELLCAVHREAARLGLRAICLRADYDDWPKDWYLRLGFMHVGTWARFKLDHT